MTVAVVGSCNLDLIVETPALPAPGQTVLGTDVVMRTGGKGANQAVAARRLGAPTVLVSALGNDAFAQIVRAALAAEDLDLRQVVEVDAPTGIALVIVDAAATNQIVVAAGANRRLGPQHLGGLAASVDANTVLLLQLEIPVTTCLAAARIARDAGARIVLNTAPLRAPLDPDLERLFRLADVVVANENEALALAPSAAPVSTDEWLAFARRARDAIGASIVITLGASGAVAADRSTRFFVPAFPVAAVDTTGAGDAFCGALAAALADGRGLHEAVRQGCAAGALATTAVGAQSALPHARDIEALYARAGSS